MKNIEPYTSNQYAKIPVICGPTASGKSSLALSLCEKVQGELCSCDSMQVYRHMDIGTAKPTRDEQLKVVHHLIDLIEPSDPYSVAQYRQSALDCIADCLQRGKLPVFCGGTGQYVSALALGIEYVNISIDPSVHNELQNEWIQNGMDSLYEELLRIDPISAAKIHPNNVKRVIRALEIYRQTGKTMTYFNQKSLENGPEYPFALYAIQWDREVLYRRMDERVDQMLSEGLLDEVCRLKDMGLSADATSLQAIGYKELIDYLQKNISLDEAVKQIKQNTRNYGKRQLTWFRNMGKVTWIMPGDAETVLRDIQANHRK